MKMLVTLREAARLVGMALLAIAGPSPTVAHDAPLPVTVPPLAGTVAPLTATATPTYSPTGGTYPSAQTVSIADSTAKATIYYTTNGATPTTSSTKYTAPIAVSQSETLKAIAVATGFSGSAVASAAYTIELPAAVPVFSPKAGTYTAAQTVSLSDAAPGASIFYTTNGTTPTTTSTKYTAPIAVDGSATLEAIAIAPGDTPSAVASATYNITNNPDWAKTFLFSFDGPDGSVPLAGLIIDGASNLYGTTTGGGAKDYGTVFKITPAGAESIVYSFGTGTLDGTNPDSLLILDGAGNLYGTTAFGGAHDLGAVFKISAAGKESVVYSFGSGGTDGVPNAGLILDGAGNLYGTTYGGGTNGNGTVFKITAAGKASTVYAFGPTGGADGMHPYAGLITDVAGNFYGTTYLGGVNNTGTVFKISAAGAESVLYSFGPTSGTDARLPHAVLVLDSAGDLYGTTDSGGANGTGTVFKLSASGAESVLHSFGPTSGTDGHTPETSLILDSAGNVYGTTYEGGANKTGTVFEISAAGKETVLYSFGPSSGSDGQNPHTGLVLDSAGDLYGTTEAGGAHLDGTVFRLSAP
jgi:uncharacterized repeat protein (TIGR03803 family)